jgi:hypothetical protein
MIYSLYTTTPCALQQIVNIFRAAYANRYYTRLRERAHRLRLIYGDSCGKLDHNMCLMKLRTIDADWQPHRNMPPGHWGFVSVDTVKALVAFKGDFLRDLQDTFVSNHIANRTILPGDHQFSANMSMTGAAHLKAVYTLMNDFHYLCGVV